MFDLSDRTIVITGGNGGIGLGFARGVARAGANVSIWARNQAKSDTARAELEALGAEVMTISFDVAEEDQILAAIDQTADRFGRIHSCFANAGYGAPGDPLKISLDEWRSLMSVNLDGTFLTLRCVANHMIENGGGGKLVETSSMVESFASPMQAHYAASKAAIGSLVKTFAARLARHDIQVNSVLPGWVKTDQTVGLPEALDQVITKRTPARCWGQPSDFKGIAVYLASDSSAYHTGDDILIDGGYTIF